MVHRRVLASVIVVACCAACGGGGSSSSSTSTASTPPTATSSSAATTTTSEAVTTETQPVDYSPNPIAALTLEDIYEAGASDAYVKLSASQKSCILTYLYQSLPHVAKQALTNNAVGDFARDVPTGQRDALAAAAFAHCIPVADATADLAYDLHNLGSNPDPSASRTTCEAQEVAKRVTPAQLWSLIDVSNDQPPASVIDALQHAGASCRSR